MIREFEIDTHHYPFVVFCIVGTPADMIRRVKDRWDIDVEADKDSGGFTFDVPGGACVWLPEFSTHYEKQSYLVHEISHVLDFLCAFVEMPCSLDTGEPRAYLKEYIFKEFNKHWANERNAGH